MYCIIYKSDNKLFFMHQRFSHCLIYRFEPKLHHRQLLCPFINSSVSRLTRDRLSSARWLHVYSKSVWLIWCCNRPCTVHAKHHECQAAVSLGGTTKPTIAHICRAESQMYLGEIVRLISAPGVACYTLLLRCRQWHWSAADSGDVSRWIQRVLPEDASDIECSKE